MAQTPQQKPQEQQHSAMFEALAATSFEYDEICGLLASQQRQPSSAVLTETSGSAAVVIRRDINSKATDDIPYWDRGVGPDDDGSVPVVKSWWGVALRWTGWTRRPDMYRAVCQ
ncbi:hypothetical protein PG994_000961 [Apiospora phragmitis]|uniref:Uncharacterized protein n=1 Tax=Apiospora phragmitis TaxID=2905665 RepID=A0ABR1WRP9_9PEZI